MAGKSIKRSLCCRVDKRIMMTTLLVLLILFLALSGCTRKQVLPPDTGIQPDQQSEQRVLMQYSSGPAGSLFMQAKASFAQGKNSQAELMIERALRIEPSNPGYWYYMGKIKYRQNKTDQAIQFCLKSKSLAARDGRLLALNDELIDMAYSHSRE